jgi:hypothetical protein
MVSAAASGEQSTAAARSRNRHAMPDGPTASMPDLQATLEGPCNGPGAGTCRWVDDIGHLGNDRSANAQRSISR